MSGIFLRRLRVSRLRVGNGGNMAALTALLMPVLVGAAGLASDTAQWVLMRRSLQRQADSAALAGAYALTQGRTANSGAISDLAKNSNFVLTSQIIENAPTVGPWAGNADVVRVRLVATSNLPFSSIFLGGGTAISAEASAGLQADGDFCILALDTNPTLAITNSGNTTVDARCGMHSNSSGEPAVTGQGSAVIVATPVSAVGNVNNSSGTFAPGTVFQPYSVAQRDPYASLPDPTVTGGGSNIRVNSNQTRNLTPGTYRDFRIQGTVNLAPGVYIIDGSNGGELEFGAQSVINGTGVTFVLSSSTMSSSGGDSAGVSMNGGATMNLSAPTTGTYKGVLIYQDRRTTAMSERLIINGNSSSLMRGAIYVPRNEVQFNGTTGMDIHCLQMVAYRFTFSGNSQINNICPANSGSGSFKGNTVRLMG